MTPDFRWRNVSVISSHSFCEEWGEEELSHMAPELIFPNVCYLEECIARGNLHTFDSWPQVVVCGTANQWKATTANGFATLTEKC